MSQIATTFTLRQKLFLSASISSVGSKLTSKTKLARLILVS